MQICVPSFTRPHTTVANMAEWLYMIPLVSMISVYLSECSLDFVQECSLNGFTPNLLCSTCDLMDDFKLGLIKPDCLQCCQKDQIQQTRQTKYPYAELVVCACKFGRYPQVEDLDYTANIASIMNLLQAP